MEVAKLLALSIIDAGAEALPQVLIIGMMIALVVVNIIKIRNNR